MKELYIAPEVNLIGFVAAERMASNTELDYNQGGANLSGEKNNGYESGDIRLPIISLG